MQPESLQNTGQTSADGTTFAPGHNQTLSELMLSVEDSPARISALLDVEPESTGSGLGFGPNSPGSFAHFDLNLSSWKTAQRSLFEDLAEFLVTWPHSGLMRNGLCYPHADWVPHTCEDACSLWPTMRRFDSYGIAKRTAGLPGTTGGGCSNLSERIGGLPSPMWAEWLMGFPENWTSLELLALGTPSSPKSPSG